jgi:hypothetical protein
VAAFTSAGPLVMPGIAAPAMGAAAGTGHAVPAPGSLRWTSVHDGSAYSVVAGPDGDRVFVIGSSLVAYDAGTGTLAWPFPGGGGLLGTVSPDGRRVFVTRTVGGGGSTVDISTLAVDAATGKLVWARRYNGRANRNDEADAIAVSPGGGRVLVTGSSQGRTSGFDYATVAYDAITGKRLWTSRYNGRADRGDHANAVALSPDGRRVFVTGTSAGRHSGEDFATVAYAAANGAPLWVRRFNGGANLDDYPGALLVSPRGGTVVVAGTSRFQTDDYAAVAYNSVTGAKKWFSRFNGDFHEDSLRGAAISPDGTSLYLTGCARIFPGGGGEELVAFTVAVNSATGTEL